MCASDSSAALIGQKYGNIRLFNQKTLEGSFAFLFTTVLIFIFYNINLPISFIYLISFSVTLVELFTPTKYDNLAIPIASSVFLKIGLMI